MGAVLEVAAAVVVVAVDAHVAHSEDHTRSSSGSSSNSRNTLGTQVVRPHPSRTHTD